MVNAVGTKIESVDKSPDSSLRTVCDSACGWKSKAITHRKSRLCLRPHSAVSTSRSSSAKPRLEVFFACSTISKMHACMVGFRSLVNCTALQSSPTDSAEFANGTLRSTMERMCTSASRQPTLDASKFGRICPVKGKHGLISQISPKFKTKRCDDDDDDDQS